MTKLTIDCEEFYNLAQCYRWEPVDAAKPFNALIEHIDARLAAAYEQGKKDTTPTIELAHGHRQDYYLLANCRRIAAKKYERLENWILARDLFATGSSSAHQICVDAGIDPCGYKVERLPKEPTK